MSCSSDYDTAADATETSSYVSAKGYISRFCFVFNLKCIYGALMAIANELCVIPLLFSCRETETFESVTEDDQLPQIVEELHDLHVSPGAPIAKMQLKVKGRFIKRWV